MAMMSLKTCVEHVVFVRRFLEPVVHGTGVWPDPSPQPVFRPVASPGNCLASLGWGLEVSKASLCWAGDGARCCDATRLRRPTHDTTRE